MPDREFEQTLLSFVDQNKYDAERLWRKLEGSTELTNRVAALLRTASAEASWPKELQDWKLILLGMIGNEIGGIASPFEREKAAELLFAVGDREGYDRALISMAAGQISKTREKLGSATIQCR
jgi:hypothetical protein